MRREYELPVCSTGDRPDGLQPRDVEASNGVSLLEEGSLSFLFSRQVVGGDDYSYCGTSGITPNEVCWSNCDAKAECGKNAKVPGQKCPLNIMAPLAVASPIATSPDPRTRTLNSWIVSLGWRYNSECQGMPMKDIPVNSLTHLYFSFAFITPNEYNIVGMEGLPSELFSNFTDLKKDNSSLKMIIAIGGWTHNDPGPLQKVFSDMVSTKQNRSTFIENLMAFLRQCAFDGVDFDWVRNAMPTWTVALQWLLLITVEQEYPGADDRGGMPEDGVNFNQFLKELGEEDKKQPKKYIVSYTAPTSFWYLRHFDLKSIDYVDFVNVMSDDLHGVWDRDNPIGSNIYGHTNLTEMSLAFGLFWRNDVPAGKLNMGLGFFGRAFQLADPACNKPGCVFKGGATKRACSGESGILSYREIMEIIRTKKLKPVHDKEAGVKYITWNTDQWMSYDDKETFEQKKDLAKELGLGDYLIWASDQDDDQLSALSAVLDPKPLGDFRSDKADENWTGSNDMCYISKCGDGCNPGDIKITQQKCAKGKDSKLCCPLSGAPDPKECTWRGGPHLCNGHCHDDEVMTHMSKWGGGADYWDGNAAHCCKSPLGEENTCYWGGVAQECKAGHLPLTFSGTVLSILDDIAEVILLVVGRAVPLVSLTGRLLLEVLDQLDLDTNKLYCCPEKDVERWKHCAWYGKPGSCFDGHCPDMKFVQLTDSYFGGGETCGIQLSRVRTFCCESAGDPLFFPVPLGNLFEHPPDGDSVDTDFSLETDESSAGGDDDPNEAAFQFVVLASPEELQVSVDKRDGEHTVSMVCTDFSEKSNCHKIGLGHGVPGTILQMPPGCGPGKYAVAKSMEPAQGDDHVKLLPRRLAHLAPRKPVVYSLTFDYDFAHVPRDLGSTQMRIDFSNQDDYWDTVVAGSLSKKKRNLTKRTLADVGGNHVRWLEEEFRDGYHFGGLKKRDLHERWFGTSILEWLAQLVKAEIKREFMHRYDDTLTDKLIDETWFCSKGDVGYEGHLFAQSLHKIKVKSSFGFTLIVSKLSLPLDLSQSYLTFYNKGEITGVMTLEAVAKVFYEKKSVILNIPFPGASFKIPGIATIGPQLTVEGSIDASLAVAGTIETKLEIAKWEVRQVVPDNNDDAYKPKEIGEGDTSLDRTGDFEGIKKPEFYAGVAVQDDVTARLSAAAEFGIRFDERWEVKPAAAAVVGEASVIAKLTAGVSTNAVCPFTYSLDVGARLYSRVQAPQVFDWSGGEYDLTPKWNKGIVEAGTFPDLGAIPSKRDLVLVEAGNYSAADRNGFGLPSQLESAGSADHNGIQRRSGHLAKRVSVHGPVLSLPVDKFFCPPSNDPSENESSSCKDVEPAWDRDKYLNEDYEGMRRRRSEDAVPDDNDDLDDVEGETLAHIFERTIRKKAVKACGLRTTFNYPTDGSLATGALIYGWEQPDVCGNYDWGGPLNARVAGKSYHSEHILEAQMVAQFFAYVDERTDPVVSPDPNASPNRKTIFFCDYVNVMFDINAVAAQFPTHQWKTDEYVALESVINTPAKGKAWGTDDNIINTSSWLTDKLPNAAGARAMLKSMRSLIGSRLILRLQKGRVGAILGLLDTTVLHANPPPGFVAWPQQQFQLMAEWDTFMKGEFLMKQTKTMKVINDFMGPLREQWTSDAVKQANEDQPGDSATALATKQGIRNLIDDIEAMNDYLATIPAWQWAF
ncbi:Putative glycoside hydrolase family 18, catalytic domain, glycoside hydrolase superfamily [Colletotrichum destructivum]|uniref:chitinase n=1 Tax=Colletotrichum destructivum TaxID=34406 RepID=A0AAX4I8J4_9PEZI|nr:Putative glycoside hydrolase family 18, catalytic domain, glycoside hydrolase superfamily [Colletotrichum destructivum]